MLNFSASLKINIFRRYILSQVSFSVLSLIEESQQLEGKEEMLEKHMDKYLRNLTCLLVSGSWSWRREINAPGSFSGDGCPAPSLWLPQACWMFQWCFSLLTLQQLESKQPSGILSGKKNSSNSGRQGMKASVSWIPGNRCLRSQALINPWVSSVF